MFTDQWALNWQQFAATATSSHHSHGGRDFSSDAEQSEPIPTKNKYNFKNEPSLGPSWKQMCIINMLCIWFLVAVDPKMNQSFSQLETSLLYVATELYLNLYVF